MLCLLFCIVSSLQVQKTSNSFALYMTIGRIISMLAGFVMPLILIRFMSQSDYGVFSQFFTIFTALYIMLALGLHSSLYYYYPFATQKNECVGNTLGLLIGVCILFSAILFLPITQDMLFGDSELSRYGNFVGACIILAIPMNMISPLYLVREDRALATFLPGIVAFARIGTSIAMLLIYGTLKSVFVGLVCFQGIVLLYTLYYAMRDGRLAFNKSLAKQQLAYSLPFGGAVALQLFSNYFDKFVCVRYLTPVEYAVYSVAFLSIPGVNQVCESLCQVNVVNMTVCHQSNNPEGVIANYRSFVIKTLSFSTPLILAVCVFSEEIMSFLFTDQYVGSAPFFRLYSLSCLTYMLGAGTILRAVGKTGLAMRSYLISCIVGIPLTIVLVAHYGVYGAITGALVNIMLPRIIQMWYEYRALGVTLAEFLPWSKLIAILGIAISLMIPLIAIKCLCTLNIFVCMACCGAYVFAAYAIYMYRKMFLFSWEEMMVRVSRLIDK